MAERITDKMLEARVKRLNEVTNSPLEYMTVQPDGSRLINIGHHHLSHAYGGVCVHRTTNTSGGVRTPIISYHTTKRELFGLINAYLDGYEESKEAN